MFPPKICVKSEYVYTSAATIIGALTIRILFDHRIPSCKVCFVFLFTTQLRKERLTQPDTAIEKKAIAVAATKMHPERIGKTWVKLSTTNIGKKNKVPNINIAGDQKLIFLSNR